MRSHSLSASTPWRGISLGAGLVDGNLDPAFEFIVGPGREIVDAPQDRLDGKEKECPPPGRSSRIFVGESSA